MGQHLLPIHILFHATFGFVYLPIIVLGFTWVLTQWNLSNRGEGTTFGQYYFDGITALAALVGLGIFAALDILTIRMKVNQCAFLVIEIIAVVLMPLSIWPIIVSSISAVWSTWFNNYQMAYCNTAITPAWFCSLIGDAWTFQEQGYTIVASFVAATLVTLGLNTAYILYICIAAIASRVRGHKFLPIYPGESTLSSPGKRKKWRFLGTRRTPTERAAMVSHCADYIFHNSVFRKHPFEPTIWAIFRGIIAVYACVGLVVFSVYSALSEAHLRGTFTVNETISIFPPSELLQNAFALSVASFLMSFEGYFLNPNPTPEQNLPMLSGDGTSGGNWRNTTSGFWTASSCADFNISWTGDYSLVTWVTSLPSYSPSAVRSGGNGFSNSTQAKSTNPLVLAPFKNHSISIIGIEYILPDCQFILWAPEIVTSVDTGSGSNTSVAIFSFNRYQQQMLVRDLRPPSMFSSVAHVLSDLGGTLSFIDGLFALVFGRTIVAIIFGTRIVSPFGLLGMVTHNRFKHLIHDQYPRMQEDIERGGMAAYISEVAIDAALIDKPSVKGYTSSTESSRVDDAEEAGENVEPRRWQTGSSASHLRLPYIVEELGDYETIRLDARKTDHE